MGAYQRRRTFKERFEFVAELFPALRDRRSQRAGSLSGGERQMVAMGRALMMEPSVLLLDEPSAGLSPVMQDEVFVQTRRINRAGVSVVMVEQNAAAACRSATAATSSTRAATPTPAPARRWPRTPRSSSSTSAPSPRTRRRRLATRRSQRPRSKARRSTSLPVDGVRAAGTTGTSRCPGLGRAAAVGADSASRAHRREGPASRWPGPS